MEKLIMKSLIIKHIDKGFSLIEVVVALCILSISVITIYNLIISTAVSSHDLEQRYLAKEVANNRIALINTIEKLEKKGFTLFLVGHDNQGAVKVLRWIKPAKYNTYETGLIDPCNEQRLAQACKNWADNINNICN